MTNNNKKIVFIRHGQTHDNVPEGSLIYTLIGVVLTSLGKVLSGWNGTQLTCNGVHQAVEAGKLLLHLFGSRLGKAVWVKSPQIRVAQTFVGVLCGAMLNPDQLRVFTDPRFMERSAGTLTDLTWQQAAAIWEEMGRGKAASVFNAAGQRYPNGESLRDVYDRAVPALLAYVEQDDLVIVVSHELTIKAMLVGVLDGALSDEAFDLKVPNGQPIVVELIDGNWQLITKGIRD